VKLRSNHSEASVAYLGPAGTFTHRTVQADPTLAALRQVPCQDAGDVVSRVEDGSVTFGVLAWENSVAGIVGPTADLLAGINQPHPVRHAQLRRDVVLPVQFHLVGRTGAAPERLTEVASHPHALNQCRAWLATHAPAAALVPATSTAAALRRAGDDPSGRSAAVAPAGTVGAAGAAGSSGPGFAVLATELGEKPDAETRFVVLGRDAPARTSQERTVIACFQPQDRPGSLHDVLQPFAAHGIDLLRIESRPTRDGLGRYYFLLECRGHHDDAPLNQVTATLRARGVRIRVLGVFSEAVPGRLASAATR
jgi:prephenate dehydratase